MARFTEILAILIAIIVHILLNNICVLFTVQEAPWRTPLATAFVEAGVEMGFENRDGNGANQTGFMIPQGTIRRGSRCSTAKAFLRPIRHRSNLHIAMHAMVTKVLIDPTSKIAYGVRFKRNSTYIFSCRS